MVFRRVVWPRKRAGAAVRRPRYTAGARNYRGFIGRRALSFAPECGEEQSSGASRRREHLRQVGEARGGEARNGGGPLRRQLAIRKLRRAHGNLLLRRGSPRVYARS